MNSNPIEINPNNEFPIHKYSINIHTLFKALKSQHKKIENFINWLKPAIHKNKSISIV
jgi:hypothetical protein